MATEEGKEWIADLAEFKDSEPRIPDQREVTRLITYRGTADAMAKQLGRSLPDGLREGKVDIMVRTLEDSAGLLLGTAAPRTRSADCSRAWGRSSASSVPRAWRCGTSENRPLTPATG